MRSMAKQASRMAARHGGIQPRCTGLSPRRTEMPRPVATRPLWMQRVSGSYNFFYFHDGNKNVSDLVSYQSARGVPAHYEYAPFGAVTAATTNTAFTAFNAASTNPYRFSSEYADDVLGLVYYNYRHYNPCVGRWLNRDPIEEEGGLNLYCFGENSLFKYDALGQYVNLVYEVEKKTLTATDVDTSETLTLKEKVFSGNGKSCCVKADQWKSDVGPLPVGKYLVGLSYVPKQHSNDTGDYNWYRLYGDNEKGGYTYDGIPVKTPDRTTVYRGNFNLHTGRASNGCVTVWSDVKRGEKGYPHSDDYDKLKKLLDKTKPLKYKNSNYTGWLEVK